MKKLFLIFNHTLTQAQKNDAISSLGVNEFITLPEDLQAIWSAIPSELPSISEILCPIKDFIKSRACKNDFVLIQGDFGACYELVSFCKEIGVTAVYSTNQRVSTETVVDGIVHKTSQFRHCIYRKY